jgi:hypothetical protein
MVTGTITKLLTVVHIFVMVPVTINMVPDTVNVLHPLLLHELFHEDDLAEHRLNTA